MNSKKLSDKIIQGLIFQALPHLKKKGVMVSVDTLDTNQGKKDITVLSAPLFPDKWIIIAITNIDGKDEAIGHLQDPGDQKIPTLIMHQGLLYEDLNPQVWTDFVGWICTVKDFYTDLVPKTGVYIMAAAGNSTWTRKDGALRVVHQAEYLQFTGNEWQIGSDQFPMTYANCTMVQDRHLIWHRDLR